MFAWLFIAFAFAATPTGAPHAFDVGNGDVHQVTSMAGLVVAVSDDSAVWLHKDDWGSGVLSPCTVTAAVLLEDSAMETALWVGCSSGDLYEYQWGSEGWAATAESAFVNVGAGVVERMFEHEGRVLAVVTPDDGSAVQAVSVDTTTGLVTASVGTYFTTFADAALNSGRVMIGHDDYRISTVFTTGSLLSYVNTFYDLSVSSMVADPLVGAYVLDVKTGELWQYYPDAVIGVQILPILDDLSSVQTMASFYDDSEEWLLIAFSDELVAYDLSSGRPDTGSPLSGFENTWSFSDLHTSADGYHWGGTKDGALVLLTDRPWVADLHVALEYDEPVEEEDTGTDTDTGEVMDTDDEVLTTGRVIVTFQTDRSGEYALNIGGTWEGSGTNIASGSVDSAGEHTVEVAIDTSETFWVEGTNAVYLFLVSADRSGHDKATISLDTSPGQVALDSSNIGFDDGALILSFDALSDSDIARYDVYVTTEEFSNEDWLTGGPEFVGDDLLETPISISDFAGADRLTQRIEPLTNQVTYYVAVRAVDASGLEGPMSLVISETPRPSYNASETAQDPGGNACASGALGMGWWAAGVALLMAGGRRRKSIQVLFATIMACGLMGVVSAEAKDKRKRDMTPQWGQFEIRYGPIYLEDFNMTSVYGNAADEERKVNYFGEALQLEFGPQLFRFFELDLGVGFVQELDFAKDDSGAASTRRTMFTWYPLSIGLSARLHFWDEQILVPYGSYGRDWIIWNEKADNGSGGKDVVQGVKHGYHWAVGISFLLDVFDFGRASLLEAHTGINDTYLTIEYRDQVVNQGSDVEDGSDQLSFSGRLITAGLKFDF